MGIEIPQTIAQQIGERAFRMIGASDFIGFRDGLQFEVGSNPERVTHIQILLTPLDTYEFRALRLRDEGDTDVLTEHSNVYCDMLCDMIEAATGLVTTMPVVIYDTTKVN